jgi:hypothetical protein
MGGENVILDDEWVDKIDTAVNNRINKNGVMEFEEMVIRDLIQTLRAAWNERDDYRAILQEIANGSDSPQYIASCILARYDSERR